MICPWIEYVFFLYHAVIRKLNRIESTADTTPPREKTTSYYRVKERIILRRSLLSLSPFSASQGRLAISLFPWESGVRERWIDSQMKRGKEEGRPRDK